MDEAWASRAPGQQFRFSLSAEGTWGRTCGLLVCRTTLRLTEPPGQGCCTGTAHCPKLYLRKAGEETGRKV